MGCGSFPLFLTQTRFKERYGIDRNVTGAPGTPDVHLLDHDVSTARRLPFEDSFFDVVTMLAVFEHLDQDVLTDLLREIDRVLVAGGALVLTTPASWTSGILRSMSRLGLVSHDEIDEHRKQYTSSGIIEMLQGAGFARDRIQVGSFELGLNLWARAFASG